MLTWKKNLPLRKGALVADTEDGTRYWIHRHEKFGQVFWTLAYRLPGDEKPTSYSSGHWFARQKYAKECAERIERERDAA